MGCNWSGWPDEEVAASEIVMVEVLAGVTTGVGGTAALPPPQPVRASATQKIAAERTPQSAIDQSHQDYYHSLNK